MKLASGFRGELEFFNVSDENLGINQGLISILHQVPEGHFGVYWRGGALLKTITNPCFHLKLPLVIHFEPVQVTS
ncbi:erlin-2-B-like [Pyrus ussuriensis x Pyrus communis]|uniref:Erlin-2-B-like n=1 Tax=Pyrus ussuriensis x Pyrus communis TaxID=2448454 RepID=A0A5N5I9N6_9ROSA|nr:erlin-2-B-like [Pyrus ussuriensis x Pyrus communis]